jgi:hypothetical protein
LVDARRPCWAGSRNLLGLSYPQLNRRWQKMKTLKPGAHIFRSVVPRDETGDDSGCPISRSLTTSVFKFVEH